MRGDDPRRVLGARDCTDKVKFRCGESRTGRRLTAQLSWRWRHSFRPQLWREFPQRHLCRLCRLSALSVCRLSALKAPCTEWRVESRVRLRGCVAAVAAGHALFEPVRDEDPLLCNGERRRGCGEGGDSRSDCAQVLHRNLGAVLREEADEFGLRELGQILRPKVRAERQVVRTAPVAGA